MSWPFSIRNLIYPQEKYIWAKIRILRETNQTILVDNGRKTWIPKSQICGIKLKNNTFEIYVKERSYDNEIAKNGNCWTAPRFCFFIFFGI